MTEPPFHSPDELPLTAEDIEAAYERALSAMDAVEVAVEHLNETVSDEDDPLGEVAPSSDGSPIAEPVRETDESAVSAEEPAPLLHPREIIEAALFVGGQSLTTKRLAQMLGGRETSERIDRYIDELNAIYQEEARPYQIDFGEGGYRMVLRENFEAVRNAVFGAGPKDVKLSQDALEVLAFVAYRQPTAREELEAAGKEKANGLLRQLLRRQLISLDRDEAGDVSYSTTDRFLDVFGLASLDELPFPEDLELK